MNSKLPRLIGRSRHHPALVALPIALAGIVALAPPDAAAVSARLTAATAAVDAAKLALGVVVNQAASGSGARVDPLVRRLLESSPRHLQF